ncbi:MAG: flagellar motor protein MotB [Kiritimatiellae bacterium]|nr:flagellar motor protein MotB [Kiritimatiellia bacterium]
MKKREPSKEEQAPAYMVMYSSLWCIMLAFFVSVLSMGHQRTEDFKKGVGEIRNAFGVEGGFGLLQFMRGHRMDESGARLESRRRDSQDEQEERAALIGFFKNMLWREGLSSVAILDVRVDSLGANVILQTPIEFVEGDAGLSVEARKFLNKIGTLFYNRPDLTVEIMSMSVPPVGDGEDIVPALERATAVTRYMMEECRIPSTRLDSLGYGSTRFMSYLPDTKVSQVMLFSVRKRKNAG